MPKRRPDHVPMRTCAVCHQAQPKRTMTRVVRRPDGEVHLDPSGKAPGRGTYLCGNLACRDARRLAAGVHRALGVSVAGEAILAEVEHATA